MATAPKRSRAAKSAVDTEQQEAAVTVNTKPLFANKEPTMTSIFDFSEDLANAEAPAPLPTGDYPFEIRSAKKTQSKSSGKDMLEVVLFISPESYPADFVEGDPDGLSLTYYLAGATDTPSGRYKFRKFLESVGAKIKGTTFDPNDLIGSTGTATITHEDYEGETRARVGRVLAA